MRYNLDLLNSFCNENQIILSRIYSLTDKLNKNSRIEGYCKSENCNEIFNKTFLLLVEHFAYCKKCALKKAQEKNKKTCLEKYGVESINQNQSIKDKKIKTCIERFGCSNQFQNENIKEKIKNTMIEKYGFEHYSKTEECKDKIKETCLEKYGVDQYIKTKEFQEKCIKTNLEKYGGNPFQNEIVKEKIVKTNLEKYGVEYGVQSEIVKGKIKDTMIEKYNCEYPLQYAEFSEKQMKSSFHLKDFIFPSGKMIKCQGYEPFGLKELIENEKIDEEDIITSRKDVPNIWYYIESDGKEHRHFVDIYIPSQNRCIEIKSEYTITINDNNHIFLKQEAGKKDGYLYEIWVYNRKGVRTNIIL